MAVTYPRSPCFVFEDALTFGKDAVHALSIQRVNGWGRDELRSAAEASAITAHAARQNALAFMHQNQCCERLHNG